MEEEEIDNLIKRLGFNCINPFIKCKGVMRLSHFTAFANNTGNTKTYQCDKCACELIIHNW